MKYKIQYRANYIYNVFLRNGSYVDHFSDQFHIGDKYLLNRARIIMKLLSKNKGLLKRESHKIIPDIYD